MLQEGKRQSPAIMELHERCADARLRRHAEPWSFCFLGNANGQHAPGLKDRVRPAPPGGRCAACIEAAACRVATWAHQASCTESWSVSSTWDDRS